MLFGVISAILCIVFLGTEFCFLQKLKKDHYRKKHDLDQKYASLNAENKECCRKVENLEDILKESFLFYDTARKISPILDRKKLWNEFREGMNYLGQIEEMKFSLNLDEPGYLKFPVDDKNKEYLYLKTRSKNVISYAPYFAKLLKLCLERIELYDKLQELSIHDSLTKAYNRRYFMERFFEEFERSKKFNLSLSFLMIDIDNFKKVNDIYGHLVGDSVLKEITRILRDNIRQIDFLARFGGEEFAISLPETDKTGAIGVAERINSRISGQRINVYDEILAVSVSIGIATFPENTLYPDVLIEIADKALYKAKVSGRNRVCWF